MKPMKFEVNISAPREKVWDTLWQDKTFREWAGLIDPGTYLVGELKQGNEVQFISEENGYGVTSMVDEVIDNEYLMLKHRLDTQESGTKKREAEWTGGTESYSLKEHDGITNLIISFDVPLELEQYFKENYPKALERIKEMSEKS